MDRLRFFFMAALLAGIACISPSYAQTATAVSIISGNGQVACLVCFFAKDQRFQPMVVRVTDAKGKPVPNATVNWNLAAYTGQEGVLVSGPATQTDKNGLTSNTYFQYPDPGSPLRPFLQSTIVASTGNASTTFTATEGLVFPENATIRYINAVLVSPPQGAALSGTAGAPGGTNIQVHVDAFGLPVPNVSVRLIKGPAGPASISCATAPGADPGSVLTDANGDATCTPVFGPVSGSGSFTVLAGGVDFNRTTIGYWQSAPAILFTVTSGGPGKLQVISGNSQAVTPGQSLLQTLVAKVTDPAGAKPVGGAEVTWTVTPAAAATLINTKTASDPAGMVSTDLMISSSAANLLTVRASIAGNPNIWTAFTITVTDALATGLTADSFYNGASLQRGRIAPCGLTTIIAPGLAPAIQGLVSADGSGPLPYTLANDSVSFNNIPAPLLSASNVSGQQQLTVQAPCELTPGASVPVTVNVGTATATVNTAVLSAAPGIFEAVMSDGVKRALAARPDGSFVSLENPAQPGEIVRVYVTGMGPVAPAIASNSMPLPGTESLVLGAVSAKINDAPVHVLQSRLAPNLIGVYEVAVQIDANSVRGNNVTLSITVNPPKGAPQSAAAQVSNVSSIAIQQPPPAL